MLEQLKPSTGDEILKQMGQDAVWCSMRASEALCSTADFYGDYVIRSHFAACL